MTYTGYTEDIPSYAKVGDAQGRARLAILNVETGEVQWVDHGQADRDVQLNQPVWSEDGSKAV